MEGLTALVQCLLSLKLSSEQLSVPHCCLGTQQITENIGSQMSFPKVKFLEHIIKEVNNSHEINLTT